MEELTDLEICKRIAEIDGKTDIEVVPSAVYGDLILTNSGLFNPLTDDALCFQLMVKHGVTVSFEEIEAYIYNDYKTKSVCFDKDKTPNKAICLAIIEANK